MNQCSGIFAKNIGLTGQSTGTVKSYAFNFLRLRLISNVRPHTMKLLLAVLLTAGIHMSAFAENPLFKGAVKATPVVYWASLGRTETVRELLAKGESPNSVDEEGWSALQAAAENGHLEIVKLLVSAGANTSYAFSGKTALQFAVSAKQEKVVQYLRSVGSK